MTSIDPLARCALFVAFEGMGLLDLTGPLTVFWSASKFMEQQGRHGYARHTVSLDGGPILTAEGVTIETAPISQFESMEIDTIVIPSALDMEPTLADGRLVRWLAAHASWELRDRRRRHDRAAIAPSRDLVPMAGECAAQARVLWMKLKHQGHSSFNLA